MNENPLGNTDELTKNEAVKFLNQLTSVFIKAGMPGKYAIINEQLQGKHFDDLEGTIK